MGSIVFNSGNVTYIDQHCSLDLPTDAVSLALVLVVVTMGDVAHLQQLKKLHLH